jgi:hypothetical protein
MKKDKQNLTPSYTEADLAQMLADIEQKYGKNPVISAKGKATKERLAKVLPTV